MVCTVPFTPSSRRSARGIEVSESTASRAVGIESREQIPGCQWFLVHSSRTGVLHRRGDGGDRISRAYLRSAFWRSAKCFWCSIVASSWLNSFLKAFDASAKRSAWSSASRLYLAAASLSRM